MSLRPRNMNKALRSITDEFHNDTMDEDDKNIDYGSVGLYLTGLQVASAIVICSCSSVLSCWMLPDHAISAVRTLAITTAIGSLLVRKPIRIGRVRGVSTIFNALRPAVPLYILALIIEQLVHTCVPTEEEANTTLRRVVYHVMATVMIISAFARARSPRSESDIPFALSSICMLTIALLPPPALARAGPLCEPASLVAAGERCLRSFFFACVYIVHVYAAAPGRNISNELFICVARASAASLWILCASAWTLPFAPLQVAVVLFSRLGDTDCTTSETRSSDDSYAAVPLNGGTAENEHGHHDEHHVPVGGSLSDVEAGDVGSVASCQDFLSSAPKLPSLTAPRPTGHSRANGNGGLSFNFGGASVSAGGRSEANIAAVIARESRGGDGSV